MAAHGPYAHNRRARNNRAVPLNPGLPCGGPLALSHQSPALRPVPRLLAPELTQTAAELAPSGNRTRDLTIVSEVLFLAIVRFPLGAHPARQPSA